MFRSSSDWTHTGTYTLGGISFGMTGHLKAGSLILVLGTEYIGIWDMGYGMYHVDHIHFTSFGDVYSALCHTVDLFYPWPISSEVVENVPSIFAAIIGDI